MKRLQKRLNSSLIKEVDNRGSIHGLNPVDCYLKCMDICNSVCNTNCDDLCEIGYDAWDAFRVQSNSVGQMAFAAAYQDYPC